MKKLSILFIIFFSISCNADESPEINRINTIVSKIEKTKNDLNTLELKLNTGEFEASPPEVIYYYKPDNMELVMLQVNAGHETFSSVYTYYLNNNKVIKYLKQDLNHPESPPKKAIIYNTDGDILWKNVDEAIVNEVDIITLFEQNIQVLKAFSKY